MRITTRPTALTGAVLVGALVAASLAGVPAAATTGGPAAKDSLSFTARLVLGDTQRACSAVLVAPQWLATSAQCFADDLAQSPGHVTAGRPRWKTTATIGRTDLTTTTGQVREVVALVPRTDRDLVMARLDTPTTGITPVPPALTPPAPGERLTTAGYGRTREEWAPLALHTASGVTTSVDGADLVTEGASASDAVCAGDAGGPVLREMDGTLRLVAVNSRSWQGGCYGMDEAGTRTGAVSTRLDDITAWVQQVASLPQQGLPVGGDFDGDGKDDAAVLYDYGLDGSTGKRRVALWLHSGDGGRLSAPRVVWQSEESSWTWSHVKLVPGDFDGDGKDDIGVLYDNGKDADGAFRTAWWTFAGTRDGLAAPQRVWQSTSSWNWALSRPVAGDFDGDGKADVGVLYDNGKNATSGLAETALWTFASTGSGFAAPKKVWTSATSWTWSRALPFGGDFDGDGKDDVGALYDNGLGTDGRQTYGLWRFTSTGTGVSAPVRDWFSPLS